MITNKDTLYNIMTLNWLPEHKQNRYVFFSVGYLSYKDCFQNYIEVHANKLIHFQNIYLAGSLVIKVLVVLLCSKVKKLVYVYLTRYAEEQQDLALLSISTFQRALKVRPY